MENGNGGNGLNVLVRPSDKTAFASLEGKVVLVTGGGSGLGQSICQVLAEAGCQVVVADVREANAQATVDAIKTQGGMAWPVRLDVSDQGAAKDAVDRIIALHGRLDILVNNAGIDKTAAVDELSVEDFQRVLQVNLVGPFILSKLAFDRMKKQGGGQIVNIASTAAKRAWTEASAYHASKWGLVGLSHALHTEGRRANIRVSAVIAGGMRTPFILDRFPEAEANLQDPRNVAETVRFVLTMPAESVIPEVMVIPMKETSWP
ncbi:MAG: SDR family oxidoreductase [Rudaea sp.]